MRRFWTNEEEQYLKDHYGKIKIQDIESKLNRTRSSVHNRATILRLKGNKRLYSNPKYNVQHDYFDKPNQLNSYYAGYIDGDGWSNITKIRGRDTYYFGVCGTKYVLSWIKNNIDRLVNKDVLRVNVIKDKNKNCYRLVYGGNKAFEIMNILAKHATPFKLERKWKFFI